MKLIGTCKEEVNQKPVDFYSIGHILFGYISYVISLAVIILNNLPNSFEYALTSTIIIAIIWELFENNVLVNTRFKFNRCKDSLNNSLMDVIFCFFGGLAGLIISFNGFDSLFIGSVYFIFTTFVSYEVCKTKTLTPEKKNNETTK